MQGSIISLVCLLKNSGCQRARDLRLVLSFNLWNKSTKSFSKKKKKKAFFDGEPVSAFFALILTFQRTEANDILLKNLLSRQTTLYPNPSPSIIRKKLSQ